MNKLKLIRERKKLTQAELANLANVSRVTISLLEQGNKGDVKLTTMKAISKALNTPIEKIFLT